MELYQLEYFLEAGRRGTFTAAAKHLNLAQAALSEQMRKLEAELGAPLFHRGRRETTLTPAGETLKEHAEILLQQMARARRAVQDHIQLKKGHLTIAGIPSVSAAYLPPRIADFRQRYPDIELTLMEGTSQQVAQWVEMGQADLGILQLPAASAKLDITLLFKESFSLVVPEGHPLAKQKRVTIAQLHGEGFISYKGRAKETVNTACRAAGFEPRIVCQSSELETIRSLVGAGLGIAILPGLVHRHPHGGIHSLRLSPSLYREVALAERSNQTLSPPGRAMRKMIRAARSLP